MCIPNGAPLVEVAIGERGPFAVPIGYDAAMNAPNEVLAQLRDAAVASIPTIPAELAGFAPDEWEAAGLPRTFSSLSPEERFEAVRTAFRADEDVPDEAPDAPTDDPGDVGETEQELRDRLAAESLAKTEADRAAAAAAAPPVVVDPSLQSGGFDQPVADAPDETVG